MVKGTGPQPSGQPGKAVPVQKVDPPAKSTQADQVAQQKRASAAFGSTAASVPAGSSSATTVQAPAPAAVEVTAARTATTSTYQNPDGTKTMRVFPRPVHYQKADGTWADIDTGLTQRADGRWTEKANSQQLTFGPTANSSALVDFPIDASHDVSYGLQGALPVTATASGDTLTYAGAQTSTDVQYNALATGAKESLILHDASAPTVWTFPLQLTGVSVALDATGNAVFTDSSGQVRLTIPRGFMEDSAIDPKSDQGAMSDGVTYQLTTVNGAPALQMTLDSTWLHDAHRVFPIHVDPTTTANVNVGQSTYVMSPFTANYSSDSVLKVGTYDGGGHVANSYLYFPGVATAVRGNYVESVGLALDDLWSYDCGQHEVDVSAISSSWSPSSINTYPGVSIGGQLGKASFGAGTSCSNGTQWEGIPLANSHSDAGSQLVSSWTVPGANNFGLAVTSSGTDSNAWKQFASVNSSYPPYLYVTYADWAASSTVASSYTQPTYNTPGSAQVTMTNLASNWWNSTSMQLKARVFDSNGNEQSVNAPLVGVSGLVQTGQSVTVNAVIPVLPKLGTQYSVCFDGYVGGTVSLHDSYGIPWQGGCIGVVGQDTAPQIDTVTPLNGTVSGSLTPQLSAVGHDPDNYPGTGVYYEFQVYSADGSTKLADSGYQLGQSWSVPPGVLAWNSSYWWTVAACDQIATGAWTSWSSISTQVQQPPITSHLGGAASDGHGHSFDPQVGNYTTAVTDASVKVVGPALSVVRSYNSLDPRTTTLFGAGWTTALDMRVQPDNDGTGAVVLTDASGRAERLGPDPKNASQYVPAPGEYETLTSSASGGFVLLLKNRTQYTFQTQASGGSWYELTSVSDGEGHAQNLHYTNNLLDTVTDAASGRALHLSWTSDSRHVAKVTTDPVTGTDPSTALTWTYAYNPSNADELDQVCAPPTGGNTAPSCTTYSYASGSHLRSATLDANPASYWRLGESSGTTAASEVIANQGNDVAQYVGGVTLGAQGPATGSSATAASFNGSSSAVALPNGLLANSYVSLGLWFKTTAPGVLAEYQNGPLSQAPSHASPLLYVGTDGYLRGELYGPAVGFAPMTSSGAKGIVTDGGWHYALLTGSGASQTLYLDGTAVAGSPLSGVINPLDQTTTYIGAGFTRGSPWPSVPAAGGDGNSHFQGQIADVAMYQHTLGAPTVTAIYQAGINASTELTGVQLPSGKPGTAVQYDAVKDRAKQVTDANGGSWTINPPSVSGSAQEYRGQVMGSTPSGYWRLSDQAGTQAANEIYSPRPTPDNGAYANVTLGAAGPMAGSAGSATFDGATSSVQLPSSMIPTQGPAAVAVWFKTTTAGTILGYQDAPIGSSSAQSWNPTLYVGADGKLNGKFWAGSGIPLSSTQAVNDGKWHFAVLSGDTPTSQTLYVDGQLSAGPLTGTISSNGIHYLYLGAGNSTGWPDAGSAPSGHFNGQLADAAIFPHGLTAGSVSSLYTQATTQSAAQGASPSGPSGYDAAIISNQPSGYWRLDDASGNQATELLSSAALAQNRGTYNSTTQGTAGPWASGTSAATTFNGTTSYLQLPPSAMPQSGANSTIALWFKTTAPGVLYSFQNYPLGNTGGGQSGVTNAWNPALYVGTDHKLHGELWTGNPNNAVSGTNVDDGNWHYAVLTASGTTQQLYLDGYASGQPITGTVSYNGNGYAYLGAGNTQGGWPSAPADTSGHFNGSLADFALYSYALAPAAITTFYQKATTAVDASGLDAASAFRTATIQDGPYGYWRLNDPSGSWYAQDELGTALPDPSSGTYTSTTLGSGGPSGDPAELSATFNGTNSVLQLPSNAAPTQGAASVELWFKTTSSGVLYDYQNGPIGGGGGAQVWNPALYVGSDGKLYGKFWAGPGSIMSTSQTVTDGHWHQAVLTADSTGQSIYLDGNQAASLSGTGAVSYNGNSYVYVGAGDVQGWPNAGSAYFNGQISEVSYYPSRLTAAQASGHYHAMSIAGGPVPVTTATVTDPTGNTLTYKYDTHTAKLTSYADAYGNTTRYTYDTNGFLYTVTDPDGHTVTTGHDARGNTVSTTTCQNPSSCQTSYATYYLDTTNEFDPLNDKMLSSSDARSSGPTDTTYTTTYAYNTYYGTLINTTPPATADYPKGRVSYVITDGGSPATDGGTTPAGAPAFVTNLVDAGAYPTPASVPANQETSYRYNSKGDLTQSTSPSGLITTYTYDNLGRLATKTEACTDCGQGQTATTTTTSYTWDGQGNPLTETDPATTDAVTGTVHTPQTSYTYDADGDKTSQITADTTGGDKPRTTSWAYNSTNDLLWQVTDPAGAKTTYTYDAYGNTATKTDAAGTNYQYSYSPQGWLQQTAIANYTGNPDSPVAAHWQVTDSRAYDPAGRLATDTDAMGRTTHTYYNDDNTVAEVDLDAFHNFNPTTGQFDGTTRNVVLQTNTYDAADELVQRVTGGGKTTVVNTYDAAARPTSTTLDPGGLNRITTQTYDAANDVTSTKLTDGTTTRETDNTYDTAGDLLTATVDNTPKNSVTTHTYDQRGLPLTTVSPDGNTTTAVYDALGQLTSTAAPVVTSHQFSSTSGADAALQVAPISKTGYDTFGDATSTEDPDGNITTVTYDADGRQVALASPTYTAPGTTGAVTASTVTQYDALGRPTSSTVDPSGLNRTSTFTYDQLSDLVKLTEPAVNGTTPTQTFSYDLDKEQLSSVDPTGATVQHTYDDLGRDITSTQLVRQPTAAAYTATYAHDDAGNLTSATTAQQESESATFDAAGERLTLTDPLKNTTSYTYNLAGQVTSTTLADHTSTRTTYDQAGRPTASTPYDHNGNPLPGSQTSYDADGNPVTTTDADGHPTNYTYDALDQLIGQTQPIGSGQNITTGFGYDPAGNRTLYTDGNGHPTSYTFNTLGLPESTVEPATTADSVVADRTYTSGYDTAGERVSYSEPGGVTLATTYDADGNQLTQAASGAEAATATRTFSYDADHRLLTASAPNGTEAYSYEDRGLLLSTSGPTGTASYGYNADGKLTTRNDTAGTTAFGYDAAGRLTTAADPLTGTAVTYQHDTVGDLQSIGYGTNGATRTYSYDDEHRRTSDTLKTAGGAVEASINYTYDPAGYLTGQATNGVAGSASHTYSYDWAGRLTSWNNGTSATNYGYDNNGNRTQSGSTSATYDQRNRVLTSGTTSYTYTARGTVASSTTNGTTTNSTYDGFDQLATSGAQTYTHDALGRLTTAGSHTFSYDGTSDNVTSDGTETYDHTPDGSLLSLSSSAGGAVLPYTNDHNDLVGTFTAAGTALASSTSYDPWGQVTATSGPAHNLGYQSGWTDNTTGQVATASRWYNPTTGTFTSRDTANLPPTDATAGNHYAYADDNPLTNEDPSGHDSCEDPGPEDDDTPPVHPGGGGGGGGGGAGGQQAAVNPAGYYSANDGEDATAQSNFDYDYNQSVQTTNTRGYELDLQALQQWEDSQPVQMWDGNGNTFTWTYGQYAARGGAEGEINLEPELTEEQQELELEFESAGYSSHNIDPNELLGLASILPGGSSSCGGGQVAPPSGPTAKDGLNQAPGNAKPEGNGTPPASENNTPGQPTGSGTPEQPGDSPENPIQLTAKPNPAATAAPAAPTADVPEPAALPTNDTPAMTTEEPPEEGTCSFTPDTPVLMADRTTKPIGTIKVGDKVQSADQTTGTDQGGRSVLATLVHHDEDLIDVTVRQADGSTATLHTTTLHPFWDDTTHTWTPAGRLVAGHHLKTSDGAAVEILGTHVVAGSETMYNLTVDQLHTYYVLAGSTPVLVHNTCPNHLADVTVYDSKGVARGANPGEEGPATYYAGRGIPTEKAQGPWKGGMATHTEARATRVAGSPWPYWKTGDDPLLGRAPAAEGDTYYVEGQLPPCSWCQVAMEEAAGNTGTNWVYTWLDDSGARQFWWRGPNGF
ncbi:LamG-like jellyroll fold domain-containing protein [Kitasatospora sp. NBC_01266]|uniref:LamG-like jellyroll fold domain-containing protein n=1 Tax=Kitasatospora sp. NBC_01266 TaxID=2903572 RepID=UPI002E37119B|nr:LamG-like jellyroll fold domain-containing protein [Kitasatospora sp. NBC_01266]